MKNILMLLIIFCISLNLSFSQKKGKSFSIKSGHIVYKLTGNTYGNRYLWWDEYGYKNCMEEKSVTEVKIMGIKNKEERHIHSVMVGKEFWTADLIKKTGQKGNIDAYKDIIKFTEDLTEDEIRQLENELIDSFGGERLGKGMVLGRECEIISVMGAKLWIYKGLVLKTVVDIMGIENTEIAVSFKTNVYIGDSKFKYLPNIKYEDIGEYHSEIMQGFDQEDIEEEKEEMGAYRVKYPFEKFKKVVREFKYDKYKRIMVVSRGGEHMATFIRGFKNTLVITASSDKNSKERYTGDFDEFRHKGKACRYGNPDEEAGSILIINYPRYNMDIIIVSGVYKSKEELLIISDKLLF